VSAEFWAIIGVGVCVLLALMKTNRELAETNRRLQNFWEDIVEQRTRQ
jgi:F0F1-type ATP synthase membrane subunit a